MIDINRLCLDASFGIKKTLDQPSSKIKRELFSRALIDLSVISSGKTGEYYDYPALDEISREIQTEFDDLRTLSKIGVIMLYLSGFSQNDLKNMYVWLEPEGFIIE